MCTNTVVFVKNHMPVLLQMCTWHCLYILSPLLVFALCMSGPSRQRLLPGPGCPGDQVSHRQPETMETLRRQALHGYGGIDVYLSVVGHNLPLKLQNLQYLKYAIM